MDSLSAVSGKGGGEVSAPRLPGGPLPWERARVLGWSLLEGQGAQPNWVSIFHSHSPPPSREEGKKELAYPLWLETCLVADLERSCLHGALTGFVLETLMSSLVSLRVFKNYTS